MKTRKTKKRGLSPGLLAYMAKQRALKSKTPSRKNSQKSVVNKLAKHKAKRSKKKNRRTVSHPTSPVHSSHSSTMLNFL